MSLLKPFYQDLGEKGKIEVEKEFEKLFDLPSVGNYNSIKWVMLAKDDNNQGNKREFIAIDKKFTLGDALDIGLNFKYSLANNGLIRDTAFREVTEGQLDRKMELIYGLPELNDKDTLKWVQVEKTIEDQKDWFVILNKDDLTRDDYTKNKDSGLPDDYIISFELKEKLRQDNKILGWASGDPGENMIDTYTYATGVFTSEDVQEAYEDSINVSLDIREPSIHPDYYDHLDEQRNNYLKTYEKDFEKSFGLPELEDKRNFKWVQVKGEALQTTKPIAEFVIIDRFKIKEGINYISRATTLYHENNDNIKGAINRLPDGRFEIDSKASSLLAKQNNQIEITSGSEIKLKSIANEFEKEFEFLNDLPELANKYDHKWVLVNKPDFAIDHPVTQFLIVERNKVNKFKESISYEDSIKLEERGDIIGIAKRFNGETELNKDATMNTREYQEAMLAKDSVANTISQSKEDNTILVAVEKNPYEDSKGIEFIRIDANALPPGSLVISRKDADFIKENNLHVENFTNEVGDRSRFWPFNATLDEAQNKNVAESTLPQEKEKWLMVEMDPKDRTNIAEFIKLNAEHVKTLDGYSINDFHNNVPIPIKEGEKIKSLDQQFELHNPVKIQNRDITNPLEHKVIDEKTLSEKFNLPEINKDRSSDKWVIVAGDPKENDNKIEFLRVNFDMVHPDTSKISAKDADIIKDGNLHEASFKVDINDLKLGIEKDNSLER